MAVTLLPATTRGWSWLLGTLAVLLPSAFYTWQAVQFARWAESQEGFVCGMPLMAVATLSVLLSALLSFLAFAVGLTGYRDLPRPRPKLRAFELLLVGLPAILLAGGLLAAALSALWA